MFSATFPYEVQQWASEWMKPDVLFISNHNVKSANKRITQEFLLVPAHKKFAFFLRSFLGIYFSKKTHF
jgi:superfamily II DNA/RNA helicase